MKRSYVAVVALVVALVGGAYFASPYLAVQSLRAAAQRNDREKLEKLVDFPSVRDGIKAQTKAYMLEEFRSDPEMQSNPFAGFALALMPAMIDGAVDAFVTPEAMTNIVETGHPRADSETPSTSHDEVDVKQGYKDLDTFNVSISAEKDEHAGNTDLVFKRQGFFDWQLKRVNLPVDALSKPRA